MSNRIKIQENSVQILSGIHFKYFKVSFKIHMAWTSWALCDTALQKNISRSDLKKVPLFRSRTHFGENWNPYSAVIKKLYTSKEIKENALASEGKSCRPETITTNSKSICVSWPLSMKHAAKITFAQWKCRTFQSIIYPAEKNNFIGISSILACGKSHIGLPPPFIVKDTAGHRRIGRRKFRNGYRGKLWNVWPSYNFKCFSRISQRANYSRRWELLFALNALCICKFSVFCYNGFRYLYNKKFKQLFVYANQWKAYSLSACSVFVSLTYL